MNIAADMAHANGIEPSAEFMFFWNRWFPLLQGDMVSRSVQIIQKWRARA